MYRYKQARPTTLQVNQQYVAETMEEKLRRLTNNNEPIDSIAQRIYTERKDGVQPEYNIRTDRWEIAAEGMDYITKSNLAKREERIKGMEQNLEDQNKDLNKPKQENGGPEPTAGTDQK